MSKKIPERSELPVESQWALEDLYANDELWQADMKKMQEGGEKLASFAGKLGESAQELLNYLRLSDEVSELVDRLANYAMRRGDQDTRNSYYQGMVGQFMKEYVALGERVS